MQFDNNNLWSAWLDVNAHMRALGFNRKHVPMPRVEVVATGKTPTYYGRLHLVEIPVDCGVSTVWHEFCHALQASDDWVSYWREDGSVDIEKYTRCPYEAEAFCLGDLGKICEMIGAYYTLRLAESLSSEHNKLQALESILRDIDEFYDNPDAILEMMDLTESLGVAKGDTLLWLGWMHYADIRRQKPTYVSRKTRMAINDWVRQQKA